MWNKWWEKNIKVETGLCTLCPLHELLTHTHTHTETRTHSLSKSLTSSFLRAEKCWCVTCCWKPLSSYHHLSISSRPYIPLRAYHSGNSISCTNSATVPPRKTSFCWNPAYRNILRRTLSDAKKTLSRTSQQILSSRCVCTQWEALSQTFILLHPRACSPWPAGW